jgi:hypothetical protein
MSDSISKGVVHDRMDVMLTIAAITVLDDYLFLFRDRSYPHPLGVPSG